MRNDNTFEIINEPISFDIPLTEFQQSHPPTLVPLQITFNLFPNFLANSDLGPSFMEVATH